MKIFESYTGNALLNNALMTIEALAKLNHVSELKPDIILKLYLELELKDLNQSFKSYHMLFLNNPLINNAKKEGRVGEKTYDSLMKRILKGIDYKGGDYTCEISGLRFSKTFEQFYAEEIESQKAHLLKKLLPAKEEKKLIDSLESTDLSINRGWFPLIGGLGSDAQALPQAKFSVQIHPIIVPILQFLPLSAVLYKGGILLIDSINFEFSREFIAQNIKDVKRGIEVTEEGKKIENLKDFAKGNYLLRAIEILKDKKFDYENDYTDLNLWSFNNIGTGASCEIERVPNSLIQKIMRLKANPKVEPELLRILSKSETAYRFLEALESNQNWNGLYPNVYGSGNKKVELDGVSIPFLEAYFNEINSIQKISYAKYLAYLIDKYKTDSFVKYLSKRDAWNSVEFKVDLYAVLIKATENGEWSFANHLDILDDGDTVPIKNSFYDLLKTTHFYHYKNGFSNQIPKPSDYSSNTKKIFDWLIALIQSDGRKEDLVKSLTNPQSYLKTDFTRLIYRASQKSEVDLETVFYALFNDKFKSNRYSINQLLRLHFIQPNILEIPLLTLERNEDWKPEKLTKYWFGEFVDFAIDYQSYYFDKYGNPESGIKPYVKFKNLIESIPENGSQFLGWFYEATEKTNQFLIKKGLVTKEKWSDSLLSTPYGEYAQTFARMAIKLSLMKTNYKSQDFTK
jgi:hypothetical protein